MIVNSPAGFPPVSLRFGAVIYLRSTGCCR